MNNLTFGNERFTYYETLGGGQGACPDADGPSGVHVTMSNTLTTPAEALELAYPLRVERHALRLGSGGAGRLRGGDGVVRELRVLEACRLSVISRAAAARARAARTAGSRAAGPQPAERRGAAGEGDAGPGRRRRRPDRDAGRRRLRRYDGVTRSSGGIRFSSRSAPQPASTHDKRRDRPQRVRFRVEDEPRRGRADHEADLPRERRERHVPAAQPRRREIGDERTLRRPVEALAEPEDDRRQPEDECRGARR